MSLSKLRLEDISLYNYIKYETLGYSFIEQLSDLPLSYDSELNLYVPDYTGYQPPPNSQGRGWVLFDESNGYVDVSQEQVNRVQITGSSSYRINYQLGGIETSDTPTAATFYWDYVSVVDGWPGETPPPLPLVAIDVEGSKREGYQLGLGYRSTRDAKIHVFATNSAERDDLVDTIHNALYNRIIPVIDYSTGDYLDYDGFYNSSFVRTVLSGTSNIYFENINISYLSFPSDWSDLNKFRAVISFKMTTYVS